MTGVVPGAEMKRETYILGRQGTSLRRAIVSCVQAGGLLKSDGDGIRGSKYEYGSVGA